MAVQRTGKQFARKSDMRRSRLGAGRQTPKSVEHSGVTKLVVSCGVFVLLVGVKLFLPVQMAAIREPIKELLEKDMDIIGSFAALGRAVSGQETNALGELYQAVFGSAASVSGMDGEDVERTDELPRQDTDEQYVIYTDENIPERVQLSQEVLGFSYCTPTTGRITSYFGYRVHPTEGEERFHYGLDITPTEGEDAIAAFADGVVTVVGESSSYGKYLIIAHENGCTTLYAHCAGIHVSSGENVGKGQVIAQVGESGMATGPHLHFELQKDGIYLNPVYYVS